VIKAKIVAAGSYLPEKVVTNQDFVQEFGNKISPKALERLLGTQEHRVAEESELCSDLVVKAALNILQKGNIKPKDITRIIVSVTPGDYIEPATFPLVHEKLGTQCPAIEIKASCVGWLSGVDVAAQYLI
jgi:3-oxoacyl-[acyl-carrier-protein] synthase-3